ncbi:MAG: hypothetical protein WCJ58_08820, partial [bacterium]
LKLEEKLELKLEEKLELKFDIKLRPIYKKLDSLESQFIPVYEKLNSLESQFVPVNEKLDYLVDTQSKLVKQFVDVRSNHEFRIVRIEQKVFN